MDGCLSRHLHRKTQRCDWRFRYAYTTTGPKINNSIEKIHLKMIVAMFNGKLGMAITSYYSPTNVSEETDLIVFYNELPSLVRSIPKHNVLIIGGDMNAHVGKNVINKFSLHNSSNRN